MNLQAEFKEGGGKELGQRLKTQIRQIIEVASYRRWMVITSEC